MARFIYTDEAGTSAPEQVRVVVSVIVDGDTQLRDVATSLSNLVKSYVPAELQNEFIFHAKDIFNGGKKIDRNVWPFDGRLRFLKDVLNLPLKHQLPIGLGVVFKGTYDTLPEQLRPKGLSPAQYEHCSAFSTCMERSDLFLRKYLKGEEVGTVIAEDVPEIRKFISKIGMTFKANPVTLESKHMRESNWETVTKNQPRSHTYEIKNIVDVPHFVNKRGAPLLQVADACAFAFRRCLAKQPIGNDLVSAMLGDDAGANFVSDPSWFELTSSGLFNTQSYWSPEQLLEFEQSRIEFFASRLATVIV